MLILTRRRNECVKIGDEITVTVLGVKGEQIKLGFDAPPDVAVHREEIYDRIKQEDNDNRGNRRLKSNTTKMHYWT